MTFEDKTIVISDVINGGRAISRIFFLYEGKLEEETASSVFDVLRNFSLTRAGAAVATVIHDRHVLIDGNTTEQEFFSMYGAECENWQEANKLYTRHLVDGALFAKYGLGPNGNDGKPITGRWVDSVAPSRTAIQGQDSPTRG